MIGKQVSTDIDEFADGVSSDVQKQIKELSNQVSSNMKNTLLDKKALDEEVGLSRKQMEEELNTYKELLRLTMGLDTLDKVKVALGEVEKTSLPDGLLKGVELRYNSKLLMQEAFIRLLRVVFYTKIMPLPSWGVDRSQALCRYYIGQFTEKYVNMEHGDTCLGWEWDMIAKFPKCKNKWKFEYKETFHMDHANKVIYADIHTLSKNPQLVGMFDLIFCQQVFEHVLHPDLAIKELSAITKKGGILILAAPFIAMVHFVPTDYTRLTHQYIETIAQEAGYKETIGKHREGELLQSLGYLLGLGSGDFSPDIDLPKEGNDVYHYVGMYYVLRKTEE